MDGDGWLKFHKGGKHALLMPMGLQAHLAGILRFAVQLARKGVTVTVVAQERDIATVKKFDEVRELDFNLIAYEDSGTNETNSVLSFMVEKSLFQPILDKLLADQKAGLPGPTCVIGDRFWSWAKDVAKVLSIPYYQFYSCGALFARLLQALPQLVADGTVTLRADTKGKKCFAKFNGELKIPGLPALQYREFTNSPLLSVQYILDMGDALAAADGLIVNTFYELESPQIDAIRQSWDEESPGKIRKIFPVGPLSSAGTLKDRSFLGERDKLGTDCLQWLNSATPQSVVYICLGSIVRLDRQHINELALALEASEQSFLWVLPQGGLGEQFIEVDEVLPPNFRTRMREKGLIVCGWVPQLQILAHSSIAGFVTHCGWNSIIESVASGVPMIAWPQLTNDQFLNCRHLVDVLKVAVELGERSRYCNFSEEEVNSFSLFQNPIDRVELEKAIRLLASEEGDAMRSRVQELQMKAEAAVAHGGASNRALNDLVEFIPTN